MHLFSIQLSAICLAFLIIGCDVQVSIEDDPEEEYLGGYTLTKLRKYCESSLLKGNSVALLGGSYAVIEAGDIVRNTWRDVLDVDIHNYATSDYGFCTTHGSIQDEASDAAGKYDYYILWASTNDLYYGHEVGDVNDFSLLDSYSTTSTQCGGINYTIKTIRDANPNAIIFFISSLPFFSRELGFDVNPEHSGSIGSFVKAQEECCKINGVRFINMLSSNYFNYINFQTFYQEDKLHLNPKGYERIALDILFFLSDK